MLGIAKVYFDLSAFKEALSNLEKILSDFPKSSAAPEAIYLKGVCLYKDTKNPKGLKEAYEQLQAKYPDSEWTMRAYSAFVTYCKGFIYIRGTRWLKRERSARS